MTTPLLLLVFNRPDHTAKLIDALRPVQPKHLYVVADGPRDGVDGEAERCAKVRQLVDNIDWNCSITRLYRECNLGCAQSVGGGISWFFEQVTEGIILEDDCIPDPSFFRFCTEMLEYYREDDGVMHIGGCNFQGGIWRGEGDYYFSIFNHVWGWATWRSSWSKFNYEIDPKGDAEMIRFVNHGPTWIQLQYEFEAVVDGSIDSWGYRWTYACWKHKGLSIIPNVNLVQNIGFGEESTHTSEGRDTQSQLQLASISFPLNHPKKTKINRKADRYTYRRIFKTPGLRASITRLIKQLKLR